MALIERTVIGSGTASATGFPVTWTGAPINDDAADIPQYIDIPIPANAVLGSLQGRIAVKDTPKLPNPFCLSSQGPCAPLTGEGPEVRQGLWLLVGEYLNTTFTWISLSEGVSKHGSQAIQGAIGNIPVDATPYNPRQTRQLFGYFSPLWKYPDGSIHYIVTVMRPVWGAHAPTFLNLTRVWYPYTISYEVTGYLLNDHNQSVPDEQVSCVVQDSVCNELYGYRPGKEEQSDFIETQKQSCRVGEYILWQSQMVISTEFTVPFNPAIRRGQTIRVRNASKNIDILGIVKDVNHNIRTGLDATGSNLAATTRVQLRSAEYIFRSTLGESDAQEIIDQRQVA